MKTATEEALAIYDATDAPDYECLANVEALIRARDDEWKARISALEVEQVEHIEIIERNAQARVDAARMTAALSLVEVRAEGLRAGEAAGLRKAAWIADGGGDAILSRTFREMAEEALIAKAEKGTP
jgi:hypothetical protein